MTSNFRARAGISLAVFSGVVLAACLVTFRAQADSWDKMTLLTVNEPTQVMNTYLEPGTYMLKLANSDRHIVQIFNRDRSHLINTVFAIPDYRVNVTSKSQFTFWETPPGSAKAVREWFWPGDHDGQEFPYPTQLRQIAAVTTFAPARPGPEPVVSAPPAPAPPPEPQPAPIPEALATPAPAPQEPVEIAQNSPPPAPPPAPEAQTPPPSQPAEPESLPKTASPYPLIGLGGLMSLGLYLALRVKQFR